MATERKTLPFHFVDVFAVEPLTGNPLVVVDGGTDLTLDLLQRSSPCLRVSAGKDTTSLAWIRGEPTPSPMLGSSILRLESGKIRQPAPQPVP